MMAAPISETDRRFDHPKGEDIACGRSGEGDMLAFLLVFLGAGLGGALRHAVNLLAFRMAGPSFPVGTLFVNVSGSFAMGLIAGWFALRGGAPQALRLFLATGILGGFTTFSAFSLDAALLWQRGEPGMAALYVVASAMLSLLGVFAGLALIRMS